MNPSPETITPLVTSGGTASYLRNNFNGWLGFQFKVGNSPIIVTDLGRFVVKGSNYGHTIKLVNADGTDVPEGDVTVDTFGVAAGSYIYAPLKGPIMLASGTTYILASQEFEGGDQWYDYFSSTINLTSVATPTGAVWAYNNAASYSIVNPGSPRTYGPVNLRYSTSGIGSSTNWGL